MAAANSLRRATRECPRAGQPGHKRARSRAASAIGWNPNRTSLCSIFEAGSLLRVPGAPARHSHLPGAVSAWPLTDVPRKTTHEIGGVGRRLEGARVDRPRPGHPRGRVPSR